MSAATSDRAAPHLERSLVWDDHGCLALTPGRDLSDLERYAASGVDFVSINIGMDFNPWTDVVKTLAWFRHWIEARPERYILAGSADDVLRARGEGRLAVAFDLEGTEPLDGRLEMVAFYYHLGVRQMLMAYNTPNRVGGGCMHEDAGLTAFGREVVAEMNRVGMVVDCSHTGYRTTMEVMELSTAPVIFSHSNPRALCDHERNIRDDQIVACARTGGVVGINGVGIFLGDNTTTTDRLVDHIAYVAELVGPAHVGVGLDYSFDQEELEAFVRDHPEVFPPGKKFDAIAFAAPEQLPELAGRLLERGFGEDDVRGILGGNFLRVASAVWK